MAPCASTRRRWVRSSGRTRSRLTEVGRHPNGRAMRLARRTLLVELAQGGLQGCELALDFDHEQARRSRVPRKQIHRAALPKLRVGDLRGDDPAERFEPRGASSENPGVALVDQPVFVSSQAAKRRLIAQPEHRHDGPDRGGAHWSEPACLELDDRIVAHSGALGEIHLTPPPGMAQSSNEPSNSSVVHAGEDRKSGSSARYPPWIRRTQLTKLELSRAYGRRTASSHAFG